MRKEHVVKLYSIITEWSILIHKRFDKLNIIIDMWRRVHKKIHLQSISCLFKKFTILNILQQSLTPLNKILFMTYHYSNIKWRSKRFQQQKMKIRKKNQKKNRKEKKNN